MHKMIPASTVLSKSPLMLGHGWVIALTFYVDVISYSCPSIISTLITNYEPLMKPHWYLSVYNVHITDCASICQKYGCSTPCPWRPGTMGSENCSHVRSSVLDKYSGLFHVYRLFLFTLHGLWCRTKHTDSNKHWNYCYPIALTSSEVTTTQWKSDTRRFLYLMSYRKLTTCQDSSPSNGRQMISHISRYSVHLVNDSFSRKFNWNGPGYSTWSIPWPFLTWRRKEARHQHPWHWPNLAHITMFHHKMGKLCSHSILGGNALHVKWQY